MALNTTVGIAAGSFLLLLFAYFTFKVTGDHKENEHIFLRLLIIFIFLNSLVLLAKSSSEICEIQTTFINDTTISANEVNAFHTQELKCFRSEYNTGSIFHKNIVRFVYLFWVYIIVYVSYAILKWRGVLPGKK